MEQGVCPDTFISETTKYSKLALLLSWIACVALVNSIWLLYGHAVRVSNGCSASTSWESFLDVPGLYSEGEGVHSLPRLLLAHISLTLHAASRTRELVTPLYSPLTMKCPTSSDPSTHSLRTKLFVCFFFQTHENHPENRHVPDFKSKKCLRNAFCSYPP